MWAVYTSIILSKLCNQSVICEELTKCSQGCIEIGRYDSAVQTCTLVCELWDLWPKKAVLLMQSEINLVSPLSPIPTWVVTYARGQHFPPLSLNPIDFPFAWPRPALPPSTGLIVDKPDSYPWPGLTPFDPDSTVPGWAWGHTDHHHAAPTIQSIEMEMIHHGQNNSCPTGAATWIAKALKVEEVQIVLAFLVEILLTSLLHFG